MSVTFKKRFEIYYRDFISCFIIQKYLKIFLNFYSYNKEKEMLILFYTGNADKKQVAIGLRNILPGFMVPRKIKQVDKIAKLPNGKTDYKTMKENI